MLLDFLLFFVSKTSQKQTELEQVFQAKERRRDVDVTGEFSQGILTGGDSGREAERNVKRR